MWEDKEKKCTVVGKALSATGTQERHLAQQGRDGSEGSQRSFQGEVREVSQRKLCHSRDRNVYTEI